MRAAKTRMENKPSPLEMLFGIRPSWIQTVKLKKHMEIWLWNC